MKTEPRKRPNYFAVFAILAGSTVVETMVSYVQQAAIKLPVLGAISVLKAVLVLLYFMHLKSDSRLFSYLFIAGCVAVVPLLLVMTVVMPLIARP